MVKILNLNISVSQINEVWVNFRHLEMGAMAPGGQFSVYALGLEILSKSNLKKLSPVVTIGAVCNWHAHCFNHPEPPCAPEFIFAHVMMCTQYFVGAYNDDRFAHASRAANNNGYNVSADFLRDSPLLLQVLLLANTANIWQAIHCTLAGLGLEPEEDTIVTHKLAVAMEARTFWPEMHLEVQLRVRTILNALSSLCSK